MMSNKLLIIDDKPSQEKESSEIVFGNLTETQRSRIDFSKTIEGLWLQEDVKIQLIKDFSPYSYIFIHDSYDHPLIDSDMIEVVVEGLWPTSRVVLYSGGREDARSGEEPGKVIEGISWFEIRRSLYAQNLACFIDSSFVFGSYDIKYLYQGGDPRDDKANELYEEIRTLLEVSSSDVVGSASFAELLRLKKNEPTRDLLDKLAGIPRTELASRLENLMKSK